MKTASFAKRLTWVLGFGVLLASMPGNAADQLLTFTGLGPVQLGMTVAEAEAALGAKLTPMDPNNGVDTEACWTTVREDGLERGVSYMVWNGKIVRVTIGFRDAFKQGDVTVPPVVTERGIRLNSSLDDLKKAYGDDLTIDFHPQGDVGNYDYLYITALSEDRRHGLLFEWWEHTFTNMGAGITETVELSEGCL